MSTKVTYVNFVLAALAETDASEEGETMSRIKEIIRDRRGLEKVSDKLFRKALAAVLRLRKVERDENNKFRIKDMDDAWVKQKLNDNNWVLEYEQVYSGPTGSGYSRRRGGARGK